MPRWISCEVCESSVTVDIGIAGVERRGQMGDDRQRRGHDAEPQPPAQPLVHLLDRRAA